MGAKAAANRLSPSFALLLVAALASVIAYALLSYGAPRVRSTSSTHPSGRRPHAHVDRDRCVLAACVQTRINESRAPDGREHQRIHQRQRCRLAYCEQNASNEIDVP